MSCPPQNKKHSLTNKVQAAVLSETQTVKRFIIQLLFTSVIQCQL